MYEIFKTNKVLLIENYTVYSLTWAAILTKQMIYKHKLFEVSEHGVILDLIENYFDEKVVLISDQYVGKGLTYSTKILDSVEVAWVQ